MSGSSKGQAGPLKRMILDRRLGGHGQGSGEGTAPLLQGRMVVRGTGSIDGPRQGEVSSQVEPRIPKE